MYTVSLFQTNDLTQYILSFYMYHIFCSNIPVSAVSSDFFLYIQIISELDSLNKSSKMIIIDEF